MESTCRAWRNLARASTTATASLTLPYRGLNEDQLSSLELWMRHRSSSVQHLDYTHIKNKSVDSTDRIILEMLAPSLTSLSLTLRKQRTRGRSAPPAFSWLPKLPALRRLELDLGSDTNGWSVTRWAPNIEEMTLRWQCYCSEPDKGLQQFKRPAPALPTTLRRFSLFGCFENIDVVLQPEWATNLRSLNLNWPGWCDGDRGSTLAPAESSRAERALLQLTNLTELLINVSSFGDEYLGNGNEPSNGAMAALRTLSLETLHLYGSVAGGLKDAPLPALTELALVIVLPKYDVPENGYPFPACLKRPGIKRLILNCDGSRRRAFTSMRWAERGDFNAVAETLEELVIVDTTWIAPVSYYSDEDRKAPVAVPQAVLGPALAARPNGELRLAMGDDMSWGMQCLESTVVEELRRTSTSVEKPPAELLRDVEAWGSWRIEREPPHDDEDDYYGEDYADPTPEELGRNPRAADDDDYILEAPEGVSAADWRDHYNEYMDMIM